MFVIAILGFLAVMWISGRIMSYLLRLVVMVFVVVLMGAYSLSAMDFSWAVRLWKNIQWPVLGATICVGAVLLWVAVDKLHSWWQKNHRPTYRLGMPLGAPEKGYWLIERREGWGWIEVRSKIETQEICLEWIQEQLEQWDRVRGRVRVFERKDRVYQKKTYH